jgi:2-polyprenyl-6-methoxyphenol hydroxylase-like FAD-dependent oxidoreductase
MVPNAVGLLRRLGVYVEEEGAVLLKQTRLLKYSGELISTTDNLKTAGRWQNKWFLNHRAHLHKHLKDVAKSAKGEGRPVQVHTSSKIVRVDPHTGTAVLQDGTQAHGDLIVGADGVHSVTRAAITDREIYPFKSHHSAMRFLITRESALADPVTHDLATIEGSMDMWYAADRKIVLYPCAHNTLFNFVCIHPAALSQASDDYNQSGSKNKLLEIYREFEPRVLHLLEKVDADTLKVYPLFDMEALPAFVNDRLALIGDAAHPFTPHLAQGGAMAIEDAVSLGVMLPLGTTPNEIPERLKLYNEARYERASTIQNYSRIVGRDGVKRTYIAIMRMPDTKRESSARLYRSRTQPRRIPCLNPDLAWMEMAAKSPSLLAPADRLRPHARPTTGLRRQSESGIFIKLLRDGDDQIQNKRDPTP